MTKTNEEVIQEFKSLVNVSVEELEEFLKTDESKNAGWGEVENDNGELTSVGHHSGQRIIELLRKGEDYVDDDVQHMRKVVGYCNRHLKGELDSLKSKSVDEIKSTKSYLSLKNWGHDVLKYLKSDHDEKEGEDKNESDNKEGEQEKKTDEEPSKEEAKQEEQKSEENSKPEEKKVDEQPPVDEKKDEQTATENKEGQEQQPPSDENKEENGNEQQANGNGKSKRKSDTTKPTPKKAQKTKPEQAPTRRSTRATKSRKSLNEDELDNQEE